MIHDVDAALRKLLSEHALKDSAVEIVLDAPTKDWAARRNAPTVDMYLYDIREDLRRRQRGMLNEYDTNGRVAARHLPPRHIKFSYLITAWTKRPEDEHRLLSVILLTLLKYEALPAEVLSGSLVAHGLPVPMTVVLPPPEDRSFADVWTALGGELKPSLDVVVSAPVDTGVAFAAGAPVKEGIELHLDGDDPVHHRRHPDQPTPSAGDEADRRGPAAKPRVAMIRRGRAAEP